MTASVAKAGCTGSAPQMARKERHPFVPAKDPRLVITLENGYDDRHVIRIKISNHNHRTCHLVEVGMIRLKM